VRQNFISIFFDVAFGYLCKVIPKIADLQEFLNKQSDFYNRPEFIELDPISIPHLFTQVEDIEIAGFLSAMLAWGQRKTIINKGRELMRRMDNSPYLFVTTASSTELKNLESFIHRTFQGDDCLYFVYALKEIYTHKGGLQFVFTEGYSKSNSVKDAIVHFRNIFFSYPHLKRSEKHVSDPSKGSAAKRLNMYLRWMVRKDTKGVDFGLWNTINMAHLMCPLDVHTANISRKLGLLERTINDWQAVEELTAALRLFNASDPVKYDFALFGSGIDKLFS